MIGTCPHCHYDRARGDQCENCTRVLDPACGSGNFLYVTLEHLKRLEGEVLNQLLDRLESSALFSEESCSFSQRDLLDSLQTWLDKARGQLSQA